MYISVHEYALVENFFRQFFAGMTTSAYAAAFQLCPDTQYVPGLTAG